MRYDHDKHTFQLNASDEQQLEPQGATVSFGRLIAWQEKGKSGTSTSEPRFVVGIEIGETGQRYTLEEVEGSKVQRSREKAGA